MIVSIIGCGDSAKEWFKTPCDLSIGVNDCFKFGHHPDTLLIINSPVKFEPTRKNGYNDRLHTIKKTKPKKFVTNDRESWKRYFPNAEEIVLRPFHKYLRKDQICYSKTSPFVALSYAFKLGAKDIILWGVDMIDHHIYRKGTREGDFEMLEMLKFIALLNNEGVRVWIGNSQTAWNNYLRVWEPAIVEN
jgi:hypothetical protein